MDPSKANSREYLRQSIDAEIESLEESTRVSIRALRQRRNALAPVSSLPTEVITAIFSFLQVQVTSVAFSLDDKPDRLALLRVTHVCHQWREIALDHPLFWSHIDFTTFSSAGTAEILARAKKAPLYLEAKIPSHWDEARFSPFQKELQDCISHICHLTISDEPFDLQRTLEGLVSPAPALEYLSLCSEDPEESDTGGSWMLSVPDTLFDGTNGTPRLSCVKLRGCDISWQSPLLRGLKHLEIRDLSITPSLSDWLDALDKMPQLKTLTLHWASPSLPSDVERTVTLPSLTFFEISSLARDCGLALAHLILPALTSLRVISIPFHRDWNNDVREMLPYVVRHAHGPQDTQPLQSMVLSNDSDTMCTEILAWTLSGIDVELPKLIDFHDTMHTARVALSFINKDWSSEADMGVFDAVMEALPLDDIVTVTSQRPLNEQFWARHVPRWPMLRRVRLSPSGVRGFGEMLLEDNGGSESPLLPSLKELVLINTVLCPRRTLRLCDVLMKRVEQRVPLDTLDLRTCLSGSRAIESLNEIVVDVLGPDETFETEAQILSASIARGFCHEDDSVAEDYDEDDRDTRTDDAFRRIFGYDSDDSDDEENY